MIRFMGFISLMMGFAFFAIFFLNSDVRSHGGRDVSGSIYAVVYFVLVGAGMLFGSRILSIFFSIPLAGLGIWLIIGSIREVPFPWVLINLAFSVSLFLPTVISAYSWLELKRGGGGEVWRAARRRL